MATSTETIRKITIQGSGQQSVDALTASVKSLDAAQTNLASSSQATATVTDVVTKKQLSAADAYARQTFLVDDQARAHAALAKQVGIATAAFNQGVLGDTNSAAAKAALSQRISELNAKYGESSLATQALTGATGLATEAISAFGLVLSVTAIAGWSKAVFDSAAQLDNQARTVGVSVEALQAYRVAGDAAGLTTQDTDAALQRFTRSIGDASAVVGPARTAFHDLGLTAGDLAGGTEAALPKVAAALLAIADPAQRARDEVALFGRSGQEIEPALQELAKGTQAVEDHATSMGLVMSGTVAQQADEATRSIAQSFQRLEVSASPIIVGLTDQLAGLLDHLTKLNGFDLQKILGHFGGGLDAAGALVLTATSIASGIASHGTPTAGSTDISPVAVTPPQYGPGSANFGQQEFSQYIDQLNEEARLTGLSKTERAAETEAIKASVEQQTLLGVSAGNINHTYDYAVSSLGAQTLAHVRNLGIMSEQNTAAEKIKETFASYLASLGEEAQVAGESAAQRETELATIKAAQIVQKDRGVLEKDIVQTMSGALDILKAQQVTQIAYEESLKRVNGLMQQLDQQQQVLNAGVGVDADHRALVVKDAQDELNAGIAVGDQYVIQRAQIDQKNEALQHTSDIINLGDYMANLREESSLAGLSADQREREEAVLQEMHATHGELTKDQAGAITDIIAARQETEKWRTVVNDLETGFESFFENALEKGKLDFADLWKSIEASFVQMLAQMAAQAIEQPIIIPMIQEVAGSLGISSTGTGVIGALSSLGSLGGIGGIGSAVSSGIGGIGSFLGFDSTIPALGSVSLPSLGTVSGIGGSSTALAGGSLDFGSGITSSGSIFGTSLGGLLGGVGLGSVAGSLIFGNKNDASLGSTGGAAAGAAIGSIIPGIGTIIGGLIGGVLGGGLGSLTGSGNQSSTASLTNGGQSYSIAQQGSSQNTQLVSQAAASINQAVTALNKAGVTLNDNISGVNIGSEKDYIYYNDGSKQKLSGAADPSDVVNQVLNQLLTTASATDADIQKVIQTYQGQGGINSSNLSQFLSDIGTAQAVQNPTVGAAAPLSAAAQALQDINTQVATLDQEASALGLSTSAIDAAGKGAVQALIDNFNDTTTAAIQQLTNPIGSAMATLVKTQQANLQDATDLGADISAVVQENTLESQQALQGYITTLSSANDNLDQWQQAAQALTKAESDATAAATALGFGLDQVQSAAGAAHAALAGTFNDQINDAILKITNPDLAAYNELLATQATRIQDATAAGGDLNAVYQLNTLEQQQLSSQQLQAANDNLTTAQSALDNLINPAIDTTTALANAHSALSSAYSSESSALQSTVSQFQGFATSLQAFGASLGTGTDAGNILRQYSNARAAFEQTAAAAQGGDPTALSNLQTVSQNFLTASQAASATSQQYAADLSAVKTAVTASQGSAQGVADNATQQLSALNASVTGLGVLNDSVLSVKNAIDNLAIAQAADDAKNAQAVLAAQQAVAVAQAAFSGIPGHALGLTSVPYDNYLMRAHKGERVLTASEAANYNGGSAGSTAALLAEVRGLRAEHKAMATKIEANTQKVAKILRSVTQDGTSLQTTVAA